jgi:hypothetical protein
VLIDHGHARSHVFRQGFDLYLAVHEAERGVGKRRHAAPFETFKLKVCLFLFVIMEIIWGKAEFDNTKPQNPFVSMEYERYLKQAKL